MSACEHHDVRYGLQSTSFDGDTSLAVVFRVALAAVLAVLLGVLTAISFYVVGGRLALQGPYVLELMWYLIYPVEAAVVAAVMVVLGWMLGRRLGWLSLVAIVLAAWIGELLILGSGLIADELVGFVAVYYWLLATGGPLQPIAAIVGGLVGLAVGRRGRRFGGTLALPQAGETR